MKGVKSIKILRRCVPLNDMRNLKQNRALPSALLRGLERSSEKRKIKNTRREICELLHKISTFIIHEFAKK